MSTKSVKARRQSARRVVSMTAIAGLAVAASASVATRAHAGSSVSFQTFLFSESGAPGLPAGNLVFPVSQPVIDNQGNVGVGVLLDGPDTGGAGGFTGLYQGKPGSPRLLQGGTVAPGLEPYTFTLGNRPNVNNGRIGFNAVINDGIDKFSNSSVLYTGTFDDLKLIGVRGTPVPGSNNTLQFADFFDSPRMNDSGYLAFTAGVQGDGVDFENNQGIFAGPLGDTRFVARQGDHAPGLGDNTSYFFIESPRLLPNDRIVYSANTRTIDPDTTQSTFGLGIWSLDPGQTPRLVAATGQQAPGYDPGVVFDGVIRPVSSSANTIVYQGFVSGPGVDGTNFFGLYADDGAGQPDRLVVRQGDQAPGLSPNTQFDGVASTLVNRQGQIALSTELRGSDVALTNNTAIYVYEPDGSARLVAREGDLAPGTPSQTFDSLTFGELGFNSQSQIAFYTGLVNPGDDFASNAGLFLADPLLGIIPIVVGGQLFEVAPGDFRQVLDLTLDGFYLGSGGEDGTPSSFNDSGQLVFNLFFTDGSSGTFVSSPIPVPNTALAMLTALGVASRRRRR